MCGLSKNKESVGEKMNCSALGIVADSPQAGELASLPRTMSGKPDGERSEPERPKKHHTTLKDN
jgi:hypothetical protein